ncbi:MAG: hypothetical protein LUO87_04320 [Methanomicrobiales archaeon]|nr:hypothetical protein [Methanomicrobiales archaeon]MDD1660071.1 hypothetical protein [Methanomicrobiales archaeon]
MAGEMPPGPGSADRIGELEKKVRELEALTKGLTNELLDLKSIVERMNSRMEERRSPQIVRTPGSTVTIQPRRGGQPAQSAEPEGDVVRILQSDGTMKEEKRKDSDYIVASAKAAARLKSKGKPEQGGKEGGKNPLIYAVEENKEKK